MITDVEKGAQKHLPLRWVNDSSSFTTFSSFLFLAQLRLSWKSLSRQRCVGWVGKNNTSERFAASPTTSKKEEASLCVSEFCWWNIQAAGCLLIECTMKAFSIGARTKETPSPSIIELLQVIDGSVACNNRFFHFLSGLLRIFIGSPLLFRFASQLKERS